MTCTCGPGQQCRPLRPGCWGYDDEREADILSLMNSLGLSRDAAEAVVDQVDVDSQRGIIEAERI